MEKKIIFAKLEEKLKEELKSFQSARDAAQEEANSHGGAMESRYDTFKEEAQYLVSGHDARINEILADLVNLNSFLNKFESTAISPKGIIHLGSFVTIEITNQGQKYYIFSPVGGGKKLVIDGKTIIVITPNSPLGKSLYKREVGEEISTSIGNKVVNQKIMEVS